MASPFKYLLAGRNIAAPPRHLTDDEKRLIAAVGLTSQIDTQFLVNFNFIFSALT